MTKSKQKEIKQIAEKIEKEYQPEKIILFGSFAWGKPNENSDVDLFIVKKSKEKRTLRHLEIDRMLSHRTMPIDVLVYTPKEIQNRLSLGDFFIKNIVQNGKVLYDKK